MQYAINVDRLHDGMQDWIVTQTIEKNAFVNRTGV